MEKQHCPAASIDSDRRLNVLAGWLVGGSMSIGVAAYVAMHALGASLDAAFAVGGFTFIGVTFVAGAGALAAAVLAKR